MHMLISPYKLISLPIVSWLFKLCENKPHKRYFFIVEVPMNTLRKGFQG
jgi:hypothetical protein